MEDLLATAAKVDEPDRDEAPLRVRDVLLALGDRLNDATSMPLDELQRAAIFLGWPLRSILDRPNSRLARHHEHVRWERVDELDARCLRWLGRLPGRDMREKSAATPRALAVVRAESLDVAENRLLVRLANELGPRLERRLDSVPVGSTADRDGERLRALRDVARMLRTELPQSALRAVRPALRPEPNNALLGSGRYGRLWRVWRWLQQREGRFAGRWGGHPLPLGCALGLLVAARLAQRKDAFVPEDVGTLRLCDPAIRCDLVAAVPVDVFVLASRTLCISIAAAREDALRIRSLDALTGSPVGSLEVEISYDAPALVAGRGCPLRIMWFDYGRDVADENCGWFDGQHIGPLVECIVAALDLPPDAASPNMIVAGGRRALRPDAEVRILGVDLCTLTPTVVDDTGRGGGAESCVAASLQVDGATVQIAGEAAVGLQAGHAAAVHLALASSWRSVADGTVHAATLAVGLSTLVPRAQADFEVCLPVAEGLGEPGEAALRATLPSQIRRAWLIPRAVAAALALRCADGGVVAEDEPLVVLDCGPLGFEARLLVLRRDLVSVQPDPFYWDCPLPWGECPEAAGGANREFWLSLACSALGEHADPAYVERVVDSGLMPAVVADPAGRPGACLVEERGRLGTVVRVGSADVTGAAALLAGRFEAWVDSLHRAGYVADARRQAEGRQLHVLVVGEPLSLSPVVAALRESCRRLLAGTVVHCLSVATTIASGALEFLRRKRDGLPTYELALPDLYLKSVDAAGRAASRPIFEKRRVRPGEEVRVPPLPFLVPAGFSGITLPLERDPGGRHHLAWKAVLEGEGLPLREPLRVDVLVAYRYAEDGFRISIRPHSASDAAEFPEREIKWMRGETPATAHRLQNDAPTFPGPVPVTKAMVTAALEAVAEFKAVSDRFLRDTAAWRSGSGLHQIQDGLNEAARAVGALFGGDPADALGQKDKATLADSWVGPLCRLMDQRPPPWTPKRTPAWAAKANDIRARLPKLVEHAETALSRLRHDAPLELARRLGDALVEGRPLSRDRTMCLGRVLGALSPEFQDSAVRALVSLACDRSPLDRDNFCVWWALGTAFWSDERLIGRVAAGDVERLMEQIHRALDGTGAPGIDLLHEMGIVLLALLRRRGQADSGPVDAGEARLVHLADRFEELERGFFAQKKGREARLKLGGDLERRDDVSRFVDGLCAALRGERVALIQLLEV